jgi:hypothetical protein
MKSTLGIEPAFVGADSVNQVAELVLGQELVNEHIIGV